MLPSWRTERDLSEEAEEIVYENMQLRRLIHQQKAIIQQLQIRKDSLLEDTEDISSIDDDLPEDETEIQKILIQTLPIFGQSETTISTFNQRNKMREMDAELPEPKYLELKCTKYCPPGKCKKRKRIFEVRRKPIFNSVLVSECSSEDSSKDSEEIIGDDE